MGKQIGEAALGYNLVIKFMIMLTCPLLGGLLGGAFLDKQFNTTPWLMFILTLIGLIFSVYAIYRVVTRMMNTSASANVQSQDKEID